MKKLCLFIMVTFMLGCHPHKFLSKFNRHNKIYSTEIIDTINSNNLIKRNIQIEKPNDMFGYKKGNPIKNDENKIIIKSTILFILGFFLLYFAWNYKEGND